MIVRVRHGRALGRDVRGGALVQFGIVLPVTLMVIMALGELAYQEYVQAVLTGAVQKAARDATIQDNATLTAALDANVQKQVNAVVRNAAYQSTRRNYDSYAAMGGEPFNDTIKVDGICDMGETYVDTNGNGRYDLDLGADGQGMAGDLTRYTMQVTYRRLFPVGFMKWSQNAVLSATTLVRTQPYAVQVVNNGTNTGTCP